jgi:hypothetical protein
MKYLPSAPREITLKWLEETAHHFVVHTISVSTDTTKQITCLTTTGYFYVQYCCTMTFDMQ